MARPATTTRPAPPAPTRHAETRNFPQMLSKYRAQIEVALPRHVDADRMLRAALTCFRTTPKLATCDPSTVFACVVQAAQAGLELGGVASEAHLVPRWNSGEGRYTCTMIADFRGLLTLARRSGHITDVAVRVVYERDYFDLTLGTVENLVHRPHLGADRGQPIAVYCVATFTGGGRQVEVMTWADVLEVRDNHAPRDRGGNIVGPWVDHLEAMGKKTCIRRAAKLWPMSAELQVALAADGREMGTAEAERVLSGRTLDLDADDVPELPAPDAADLLMQQIAEADTTEQLDHLAHQVDARGLAAKEARRVRDALTARAAELGGGAAA